jgi:two-component system response regulator AtoC
MSLPESRLSRESEALLMAYDFPGNVRELKNIMERAVILCDGASIEPRHLPERVLNFGASVQPPSDAPVRRAPADALPVEFVPGVDTLESLEDKLIRVVLERVGDNRSEAARILGISRFALMRRLEKMGPGPGKTGD